MVGIIGTGPPGLDASLQESQHASKGKEGLSCRGFERNLLKGVWGSLAEAKVWQGFDGQAWIKLKHAYLEPLMKAMLGGNRAQAQVQAKQAQI